MWNTPPPNMPNRCLGCFLPLRVCICAEIPRLKSPVPLLVLRHVKERWKGSNSARLAMLALPEARMIEVGAQGERFDPTPLQVPGTALLFPVGSNGLPWSEVRQLVVLDGTWAQARHMSQRVPGVPTLPRVALPRPDLAIDRLRSQHLREGMATLEAIAAAVAALGDPEAGLQLQAVYLRFVRASLSLGGAAADPGPR